MTTLSTGCVLAIGNFDGVHSGHLTLLAEAKHYAQSMRLPLHVLTFHPLPAEFFATLRADNVDKLTAVQPFFQILSLEDRLHFLHLAGVNHVVVEAFTDRFQQLSPQVFFNDIVMQKCQAKTIIVGDDFRFGKHRQGNIALLATLCKTYDVNLQTVDLYADSQPISHKPSNGNEMKNEIHKVSSRDIRQSLLVNDLYTANSKLGYSWRFSGVVIHGDKRGRELGFATANIRPFMQLPPLSGVFVSSICIANTATCDTWLPCVTNIGTRPTFSNPAQKQKYCESHVLTAVGDIYDCQVTLSLHQHLRNEQRFADKQQLITQITKDISKAKQWFADNEPVFAPSLPIV